MGNKNIQWLVHRIERGDSVMIISNRLYHPRFRIGAAAWFITVSGDQSRLISRENLILGHPQNQYSYRRELEGLIGAISH